MPSLGDQRHTLGPGKHPLIHRRELQGVLDDLTAALQGSGKTVTAPSHFEVDRGGFRVRCILATPHTHTGQALQSMQGRGTAARLARNPIGSRVTSPCEPYVSRTAREAQNQRYKLIAVSVK
jgi:hypothetical protein